MLLIWATMREAAMIRHEILVNYWYPPGPSREAAMAEHIEIVKFVYGR